MTLRTIPEYPISGTPPKIILTTTGDEVLVDAEDYPLLSRHIWYTHGEGKTTPYAFTVMKTERAQVWRCIFMHHLILGTSCTVDHRDVNSFNNQKYNLRAASYQQNGWNRGKSATVRGKPPLTPYKGVSQYTNTAGDILWKVVIKTTKKGETPAKSIRKTGFKTDREAAIFYNEQIVKVRGKFSWINPITETSDGSTNG